MHPKYKQSLLSRTFEIAQENTGWIALWCGLSVAIELILVADNLGFLLFGFLVQSLVGFYFYKALLIRSGYKADQSNIGSFLAVSVLMALGVGMGALLLIVPGVILYLRWIIAIPILLSEGISPFDAISRSWERTRGNAGGIFISLLPALGLLVVGSTWLAVVGQENAGSLVVPAVISGFGGALFFCCSTAVYQFSRPNDRNETVPSR